MDRNTEIAATGTRLLRLRQKLAARDGTPGYERNCTAIRQEIARLERSTIPSTDEADMEFQRAAEAKKAAETQSETATEQTEPSTGVENPEA